MNRATQSAELKAPSWCRRRKRRTAGNDSSGVERMRSCMSVSTTPGASAKARSPAERSSRATTSVIMSTAAFEAQ